MKVLVLADVHGALLKISELKEIENLDAIVIPGDLCSSVDLPSLGVAMLSKRDRSAYIRNFYHRFSNRANFLQIKSSKLILSDLLSLDIPILMVHGNTETQETRAWLQLFAIRNHNLHYIADDHIQLNGYQFIGHGWVEQEDTRLASPGEVSKEYAGQKMRATLELAAPYKEKTILISHAPPYRTPIDFLPHRRAHAGSRVVRQFLDEGYFEGVISGHLHESPGAIIHEDHWWGVNAGAAIEDRACIIDLEKKKVKWLHNIIQRPNLESIIYQLRRPYGYDEE